MPDVTINPADVKVHPGAIVYQASQAAVDVQAGQAVDSTVPHNLASALTVEQANAKGLAINTAAAGQPFQIVVDGLVDLGEDVLEPGLPYAVSSTPGAIKPAKELTGGEVGTTIGSAVSGSTLRVRPVASGVEIPGEP